LEEPLAIWETFQNPVDDYNILELFYENPSKYAFPFQILAFQSRYEIIHRAVQENPHVKTIVLERSLDADYHIFAKRLLEDGIMEKIAFDIYFYTIRERLAEYGSDGIIWLDVEVEECHRRIQRRDREGEGGITMDYLRGCDEAHREWLSADTGFVLRLDGSASSSETQMEEVDTYLF
jgi:deoxyadenosine/deoxycytidine kinase